MDHVDQALYTRPNLSGGTERSAQKSSEDGADWHCACGTCRLCKLGLCREHSPGASNWPNSSCRSCRPDPSVDQFLPEPPS